MRNKKLKQNILIPKVLQILIVLMGLVLMLSPKAEAFPETVRHGYLSCATCHISPSGRGILTPYGKTLSHELYSFKKTQNDQESLEAEAPWWQIGGRFRLMQLIIDNPDVQKGRFFPMQSELEASIDKTLWAMSASVGAWRPIDDPATKLRAYVRNAYVIWRPDEAWNVRAGKFRISHGLGLPDHILLVNEALGWTHSHETSNIEVSRLAEDLVMQGAAVLPSTLLVTEEKVSGGSFNLEKLLESKHKVGFNISRFRRSDSDDTQVNIHSVVSVSEQSFIQLELAQRRVNDPVLEDQWAFFSRYSQEYKYGLRPFFQWEEGLSKQVKVSSTSQARRLYIGAEWFPVVHTDIMVFVGNQMESGLEDNKIFSLIGHFYF